MSTFNRAYFFIPNTLINYSDKGDHGKIINWGGKKVFVAICSDWRSKAAPKSADIVYIPSFGKEVLPSEISGYLTTRPSFLPSNPGLLFVSYDAFTERISIYQVNKLADKECNGNTFAMWEGNKKYLDDAEILDIGNGKKVYFFKSNRVNLTGISMFLQSLLRF